MRLRMLTSLAGEDFVLAEGDVTERFDGDEAERLVRNGFALPDDGKPIERAVKRAPRAEKRKT